MSGWYEFGIKHEDEDYEVRFTSIGAVPREYGNFCKDTYRADRDDPYLTGSELAKAIQEMIEKQL